MIEDEIMEDISDWAREAAKKIIEPSEKINEKNARSKVMRRKVEIVSCDFCGEDIEGMLVTAKVRINEGQRDVPVRLYNQIFFNWGGTKYAFDICSKCEDKLANGEISISTDLSVNRSFTNG